MLCGWDRHPVVCRLRYSAYATVSARQLRGEPNCPKGWRREQIHGPRRSKDLGDTESHSVWRRSELTLAKESHLERQRRLHVHGVPNQRLAALAEKASSPWMPLSILPWNTFPNVSF